LGNGKARQARQRNNHSFANLKGCFARLAKLGKGKPVTNVKEKSL